MVVDSQQQEDEIVTINAIEDDFQQFFMEDYFQKFEDLKPHIAAGEDAVIEIDFLDLPTKLQEHFYRFKLDTIIEHIEEAAKPVINLHDKNGLFVTVRFKNFGNEVDSVNKINASYVGKVVIVDCLASSTSKTEVVTIQVSYECLNCDNLSLHKIYQCPNCGEKDIRRNLEKSRNVDFQILYVQELPERLKPGQIPHKTELHVYGSDLVNKYRAGDRIRVTSQVRLQDEKEIEDVDGGPTRHKFSLYLKAINVENIQGSNQLKNLSEEDIKIIEKFNKKPESEREEILIDHFAPHVEGHRKVKRGILVATCNAGKRKKIGKYSSKRMDSNVIMIGDPGTAKSELVKFAVVISPRGVYTSGRGSTAAGLTAAVVKDSKGQMNLEAGAMVMADQGLCGIDEFDKLKEEDRSAIHECMEQQTYSVAKAGIVATLNTRASVISAANSKFGKYDRTVNILENINIPVSLFTRFDLIYIIIDEIDFEQDRKVAEKIGSLYKKKVDLPDDTFLSKYLLYVNLYAPDPDLSETTRQEIAKYYLDKRIESRDKKLDVTITPRQLEGIYRIALSHAKMMCKHETDDNDKNASIEIFNHMLMTTGYDPETGDIDPGIIEGHSKKMDQRSKLNQIDLFETIMLEVTEKGTLDISKRVIIDEMIKYPDKWSNEMQAMRFLDRCHQNDVVLKRPSGLFYLP